MTNLIKNNLPTASRFMRGLLNRVQGLATISLTHDAIATLVKKSNPTILELGCNDGSDTNAIDMAGVSVFFFLLRHPRRRNTLTPVDPRLAQPRPVLNSSDLTTNTSVSRYSCLRHRNCWLKMLSRGNTTNRQPTGEIKGSMRSIISKQRWLDFPERFPASQSISTH